MLRGSLDRGDAVASMSAPPGRATRVLAAIPAIVAGLATVLGAVVLVGWGLDIGVLRTLLPGSVPMKANTAVALLLAGAALGFRHRRGGRWAAGGILVLGGATLAEYFGRWSPGIDELLFRDPSTSWRGPGRMALTTAAAFVVLGAALMLIGSPTARQRRIAELLSGSVALFALFEIERYALGTPGPGGYTRMALPTAIVLIALSLAAVAALSDSWLVARATDPGIGGMLTRRLLPLAIVLSLALGKVMDRLGWDDSQSIAVVVILGTTLLIAVTLWCVITLEHLEHSRRVAEAALRDTEGRFRAFFEESPIGHSITAPDGRLQVNRAFGAILGYSAAELQAASWMDLTHPDDVAASQELVRALSTGEADHREMEKRYRAKDGHWVWTRVSVGAHMDDAGALAYFLTHIQDISEVKRAAEQLRERERQLAEAQEIAQVGSWEADLAANRVTWSDEAYRIFGIPLGTTVSYDDFVARIHPEDRLRVERVVGEGIAQQRPVEYEWRLVRPNGEVRDVLGRNVCVLDGSGRVTRLAGTTQDITERKQAEAALQAALLEAKTLRGYLRVCANCRRVLGDAGTWEQLEAYVRQHTQAEFSHGICPDCAAHWADTGEFKVPKRARS